MSGPEWSAEEIGREIAIDRMGAEVVLTCHGEPVGAVSISGGPLRPVRNVRERVCDEVDR